MQHSTRNTLMKKVLQTVVSCFSKTSVTIQIGMTNSYKPVRSTTIVFRFPEREKASTIS